MSDPATNRISFLDEMPIEASRLDSPETPPVAPPAPTLTPGRTGMLNPEPVASNSPALTVPVAPAHFSFVPSPSLPSLPSVNHSAQSASDAALSASLCAQYSSLLKEGYSGNQAASALGRSPSWFSTRLPRWRREGSAAFLPAARAPQPSKAFPDLPDWFIPAAKFFYLLTNRTRYGGSIPEAIRRTISLPACPSALTTRLCKKLGLKSLPECPTQLRQTILQRQKEGKSLLPESITRQIAVYAPFVKQFRNPTDANLDYINAPGTMMWNRENNATGDDYRFIRAGDIFESDDATINFPMCIPWEIGGCPCSEKFGVKVGRFQWLVDIDAGSRFIPAFIYSARPRSSYRAEDITTLIRASAQQHGIPRARRMERGAWESHLVKNVVRLMGTHQITVHSPHNKPFIEGLFNVLWTKLAVHFPEAQVGRFMGENEEACRLLTAAQAGHQDPRKTFPMLNDGLAAMAEAIHEKNETPIHSDNYGTWIPVERWHQHLQENPLQPLDTANDWIFSPLVREWTVNGNLVGGKVPLMEGLSVPYDFSAPWLIQYHGARVKAYFDPMAPQCFATICLAQNWGTHKAGERLGQAQQINQTTSYIRLVMGYGDDPTTLGLDARRQAATALRREVRTIIPRRSAQSVQSVQSVPFSSSEFRDGTGSLCLLETPAEASRPISIANGPPIPSDEKPAEASRPTSQQCDTASDVESASERASDRAVTSRIPPAAALVDRANPGPRPSFDLSQFERDHPELTT